MQVSGNRARNAEITGGVQRDAGAICPSGSANLPAQGLKLERDQIIDHDPDFRAPDVRARRSSPERSRLQTGSSSTSTSPRRNSMRGRCPLKPRAQHKPILRRVHHPAQCVFKALLIQRIAHRALGKDPDDPGFQAVVGVSKAIDDRRRRGRGRGPRGQTLDGLEVAPVVDDQQDARPRPHSRQ